MKILFKFTTAFLGFLLWGVWLIINKTVRFEAEGDSDWRAFRKENGPIIFVFWHGITFPLFYYFRGSQISLITMKSFKGQVLAEFARRCGFKVYSFAETEHGSEGARTLVELKRLIEKGETIGLAVDGPEGPAHQVKPGAIFLAQKTGKYLWPLAIDCPRSIRLRFRWDQYQIPVPFSRVTVSFKQPIRADKSDGEDATALTLKELLSS